MSRVLVALFLLGCGTETGSSPSAAPASSPPALAGARAPASGTATTRCQARARFEEVLEERVGAGEVRVGRNPLLEEMCRARFPAAEECPVVMSQSGHGPEGVLRLIRRTEAEFTVDEGESRSKSCALMRETLEAAGAKSITAYEGLDLPIAATEPSALTVELERLRGTEFSAPIPCVVTAHVRPILETAPWSRPTGSGHGCPAWSGDTHIVQTNAAETCYRVGPLEERRGTGTARSIGRACAEGIRALTRGDPVLFVSFEFDGVHASTGRVVETEAPEAPN